MEKLREEQASHRALIKPYSDAFRAVNEQVTAHCVERGELLERLRKFFTQSMEVTARLAEQAFRETVKKEIDNLHTLVFQLQEENISLRNQSKDRPLSEREQYCVDTFTELPESSQHRVTGRIYGEGVDFTQTLLSSY